MRYINLMVLLAFIVSGCSDKVVTSENEIIIEKRDIEMTFEVSKVTGTLYDKSNELQWQNTKVVKGVKEEAVSICTKLSLDYSTDWRVPTVDELSYFHKKMDSQGILPEQTTSFCEADIASNGYVLTKNGAERESLSVGDVVEFTTVTDVRCVRAN